MRLAFPTQSVTGNRAAASIDRRSRFSRLKAGTNSIYTEKRARRVGDVITILIQELSRENIGKTGSLLSES